jgi:peptidoglycan/LPS O-acetylase OafA/YrhL
LAGLGSFVSGAASLLPLFPFSLGGLGVAIFFAVSGFCIHLSHLHNRNKGWSFFIYRRFFRIYPACIAALGGALGLNWNDTQFTRYFC